MVRYVTTLVIWGCVLWPVVAKANYIYPLPSWQVSTTHGEDIGGGLYHMGVDAGFDLPAGAPVYAVADGIVREAQERSQFGLVVLIEHAADTDQAHVSLYGHLDPTLVQVAPGQSVLAGEQIGVLGDSSNNGGWTTHLHFGIHKSAYTGDWVYYGHAYDPTTAADWYNPEKYLPKHFVSDTWQPTLELDLQAGDVVGNTVDLTGTVGDIGAGVQKLTIRASNDQHVWETIATYDEPSYQLDTVVDVSHFVDGTLYLKLIARDGYTEKTVVQRTLTKDPYRYTTPGFVAMKSGSSDAFITQWSFGGTALNAFFPFSKTWSSGGYIAAYDDEIVAVRHDTKDSTSIAKFFSESGTVHHKFTLQNIQPHTITFNDDTLVVADQRSGQVLGYSTTGEQLWSVTPTLSVTDLQFVDDQLYLCGFTDTKTKVIVMDTTGIINNTFQPFSKYTTMKGCHIAIGDITGDGMQDIIVGSFGNVPGTIALLSVAGERLQPSFRPFGDDFTGAVDVQAMQWDTVEDTVVEDEIIVSQASAGQAWVKIYNLTAEDTIVLTQRVYEEDFTKGVQIVAWE